MPLTVPQSSSRDDHVLRRIHEFAGQVTGVRGLERRIGQTFAGAVSGDEVLEHGQTLRGSSSDRPLDDFAGRLGHQTAHAGELTHLLAIAARAGIHHQIDRISTPCGPRCARACGT